MEKQRILTGDRPTGQLHLGHFVGSLANRLKLQNEYETFILIADVQALTDNFTDPAKVHANIDELMLDYLAVGLDPKKVHFVLQSSISATNELFVYYLNLVTLARAQRNPTVKDEIKQKGFGDSLPLGFLVYPIHQAADITAFKADLVPVGADQLPMIEQTNEIVRKFNSIYGETLKEVKPLVSEFGRLPGLDGQAKMSKSLNNCIYLADSAEIVEKKVMTAFTDPTRLKATDPGHLEGNVVFTYLDAFGQDKEKIAEYKNLYVQGKVGDVEVKKFLATELNNFLQPIYQKRLELAKDMSKVRKILATGSKYGQEVSGQLLTTVRQAMKIVELN